MARASVDKRYWILPFRIDSAGNKIVGNITYLDDYPGAVTCGHNVVSRSWNNAYGVFQDILIADKVKVNWKFEAGKAAEISQFFYSKIASVIHSTGSRFFTINTWAPGYGWIQADCYLGTPTQFETEGVGAAGEAASISYELHWIEIGDDTTKITRPSI